MCARTGNEKADNELHAFNGVRRLCSSLEIPVQAFVAIDALARHVTYCG